jgi:16S rRNA (cytosine1402-N4)-methyltransferase
MAHGYHKPVLLHETVDLLGIRAGGIYVDVTFGGGGHSREILRRLEGGQLFAFDKDSDAIENKPEDGRFTLVQSDFKFIESALKGLGIEAVDGILADLGISSHQVDTPHRGFSFRFDAPLDMRMSQEGMTAADVLNTYAASDLEWLLREYGEVRAAGKLAAEIVSSRVHRPVRTTQDLEEIAGRCVEATNLRKLLTLVYQALRIEVNGEMEGLEALMQGSLRMLKPGGRMSVISYHSLEDRRVKHFFRAGNFEGKEEKDFFGRSLSPWKVVTRKAIQPNDAEIEDNPRARSARLRAAEKI